MLRPRPCPLLQDQRGAALIEFAILLPVLAAMLLGMLAYGQYFLLAHSAQQFANDAARASLAGLTAVERRTIAAATVADGAARLGMLRAGEVTMTLVDDAERIEVRVTLDARRIALLGIPLVPMPDPMIERRAVMLPGGIR